MTTLNDLIRKAMHERLFCKGTKTFKLIRNGRIVELKISPCRCYGVDCTTHYVQFIRGVGLLSDHELITLCDNQTTDLKNFQHYGGRISKLSNCLAVTVYNG